MAVTRGNLILGSITDFKIGAVGAEASVGSTGAPLTYRRQPEFVEARSQQEKGILKKEESFCRYFIATSFAEPTLANVRIAFNQAAGNLSGSTLTVKSTALGEQSIIVTGPGPNASTRTISFSRVVGMSTGNVVYAQDGQQMIETEFEVLITETTGVWGTVVDV